MENTQAAAQGAIGALGGAAGNFAGLGYSLGALGLGATARTATSRGDGVGTMWGIGASTAANATLPPSLGGFRDTPTDAGCTCRD